MMKSKKRVDNLKGNIPGSFSLPEGKEPFLDIPDAHSVSVVSSHLGIPLDHISVKKYNIHGKSTQVNDEPLKRYRDAAKKLVSLL